MSTKTSVPNSSKNLLTKLKIEDLGIMPYFSCKFFEKAKEREKVERTEE